jgi:hypothetical protein
MKLLPTVILHSVQKVSEPEKHAEGEAEFMPIYKLDNISLEALRKVKLGFGVKVPSRKANSQ